jgi:integral membrane protein (TIGR01906 family)
VYINLTVTRDGQAFALFNQREILHLKDVKGLLRLNCAVLLGTLVYTILYHGLGLWQRRWRWLAQGLVWGSGATLGLILLMGLGILLDFDHLFWQFHLISFSNELWLLDPTKDYLIMLFPQGFFYNATILITLIATILALILGGTSYWLLRKYGKRRANAVPPGAAD